MALRLAAYRNPDTSERETSTTSTSPSHPTCIYIRSSCFQSANLVPLRWHHLPPNKLSGQHKKKGTSTQENSDHYCICHRCTTTISSIRNRIFSPLTSPKSKSKKMLSDKALLRTMENLTSDRDSLRLQSKTFDLSSACTCFSFFHFASTPLFAHRGSGELLVAFLRSAYYAHQSL